MLLSNSEIKKIILENIPVLDVRAPIEFNDGNIPGSTCIPILTDDERALVGTKYKQEGSDKAIALGHELVNGQVKERRVADWKKFLDKSPNAIITCFRGGLRSKTAQAWLQETGTKRNRIEGGYKAYRQFILQEINRLTPEIKLTVIGGNTGSAKTKSLRKLSGKRQVLDLEGYANHRGSAFGSLGPQPAQALFENRLGSELIKFDSVQVKERILVEDESRLIGSCIQPTPLFDNLRESQLVLIEEGLEKRIENTFEEYIQTANLNQELFERYKASLKRISNRLGGARYAEVLKDLMQSETEWKENKKLESNKIWISKLLEFYYDPMYVDSLNRRKPKVLFQGTELEVTNYLENKKDARI